MTLWMECEERPLVSREQIIVAVLIFGVLLGGFMHQVLDAYEEQLRERMDSWVAERENRQQPFRTCPGCTEDCWAATKPCFCCPDCPSYVDA